MIHSDYAPLNAGNGTFLYNYHLSLEEPRDNEDSTVEYQYTVKAQYGHHQTDFTFLLASYIPNTPLLVVTIPRLSDVVGHNITNNEIVVGEQVQISAVVKSNERRNLEGTPFVALFQIVDSQNASVYIALQSGLLKPSCSTEVGFSWMTDQAGNYQVKTFAISNWENPQVLSLIQTTQVIVNER